MVVVTEAGILRVVDNRPRHTQRTDPHQPPQRHSPNYANFINCRGNRQNDFTIRINFSLWLFSANSLNFDVQLRDENVYYLRVGLDEKNASFLLKCSPTKLMQTLETSHQHRSFRRENSTFHVSSLSNLTEMYKENNVSRVLLILSYAVDGHIVF